MNEFKSPISFKRRLAIVREYKEWFKEQDAKNNFSLIDNYGTFLAFLQIKGYLKDESEVTNEQD